MWIESLVYTRYRRQISSIEHTKREITRNQTRSGIGRNYGPFVITKIIRKEKTYGSRGKLEDKDTILAP